MKKYFFYWIGFSAGLNSHYWFCLKIRSWGQYRGSKNEKPFNDQWNVADLYLRSLLPLDNPEKLKHNILDKFNRCLGVSWKEAFWKISKISLLISQWLSCCTDLAVVVGSTCKLNKTVINCGGCLQSILSNQLNTKRTLLFRNGITWFFHV